MELADFAVVAEGVGPPVRYLSNIRHLIQSKEREEGLTKYKQCPSKSANSSQPLAVARASSLSSSTFDSSFSVWFMGGGGRTIGMVHRNFLPLSHMIWWVSDSLAGSDGGASGGIMGLRRAAADSSVM